MTKLMKVKPTVWINPEDVVRLEDMQNGTVIIHLGDGHAIHIQGIELDSLATMVMRADLVAIDDDVYVNKDQVEVVYVEQGLEEEEPSTRVQLASGQVWGTDLDLEDVLGQLDGVPVLRGSGEVAS